MKKVLIVLLLCFPLLSIAPLPCTEANAAFVIRETVTRQVQSNGTTIIVPAGQAAAWSCNSKEEAEAELAKQIALIIP